MIDAANPGGPRARAPCQIPGRQDDRRSAIGDRRARMPVQRRHDVRLCEQGFDCGVAGELGGGVREGIGAAARGNVREVALGVAAGVKQRTRLQRGDADGIGPQRCDAVRIEL